MLLENDIYFRQIDTALKGIGDNISKLSGHSVLVTGASGMLGSCIVDMLLCLNERYKADVQIYVTGRNAEKIWMRFDGCREKRYFHMMEWDASHGQELKFSADYIIYAASNADPFMFANYPVDTFLANVIGIKCILDLALRHSAKRVLYISSGEMYGQPDDTMQKGFPEGYSGFVDYKDPRSCYPSGKRAAEMLCQGYVRQYGLDAVIVRPCHCYGPTMTKTDSRALSQFFRAAQKGENIVLKSSGETVRSHCYVVDAAAGILKVLLDGKRGEAYNIADPNSITSIRKMAEMIAAEAGQEIRFEMPQETEIRGYSKVNRSILDTEKIYLLGWRPQTNLTTGIRDTLKIISPDKSCGKVNGYV